MKLSRKLALFFAGVAAIPVLVASPLVLRAVSDAFEDESARRLEAAARALEREREATEREVAAALEALAGSDAVAAVLADAAGGGELASHVQVAERLLAAGGLDVLAILDERGVVVSSGHLPARAGDPDPDARALAERRPGRPVGRFVEVRTPDGIARRLAVVAARPVARGRARVYLVAGRTLGPAFAARLAEATSASIELVEPRSGEVLAAAVAAEPARREAARAVPSWLLPGLEDRVRTVPVAGEDGAPVALLRATVSARALREVQARILSTGALLLLASLCVAAALGVLLARRIVRPVEALAGGAAAVASGDLSHRVEARASGELAALVASFNQMTADLAREKERAAVAERVAAWREVARRLAHEIKNPLTPIAMSIENLRDAHAARSPALDELFEASSRTILEEVARLKRIVDEFSRFARLPRPELQRLDVNELVASVLTLYGATPAGLSLRRELAAELPAVSADRDQLTQVLLNLVQNAEQALAGRGGAVTVRTRADGGAVLLEVADDGPGVPPEHRERIFEPYFTTKEAGTGLGLAIARRIAEEHGGALELECPSAGGAIFRLRLPAAA